MYALNGMALSSFFSIILSSFGSGSASGTEVLSLSLSSDSFEDSSLVFSFFSGSLFSPEGSSSMDNSSVFSPSNSLM